jgi:hypothetical protein
MPPWLYKDWMDSSLLRMTHWHCRMERVRERAHGVGSCGSGWCWGKRNESCLLQELLVRFR